VGVGGGALTSSVRSGASNYLLPRKREPWCIPILIPDSTTQQPLPPHPTPTDTHTQGMEANFEELAASLAGSHVRVAKYQADVDKDWAKANAGLTTFPSIVMLPKAKGGVIKYPSERRDVESLTMFVKAVAGTA